MVTFYELRHFFYEFLSSKDLKIKLVKLIFFCFDLAIKKSQIRFVYPRNENDMKERRQIWIHFNDVDVSFLRNLIVNLYFFASKD